MHAVIRHHHFDPKDSKEIDKKLTKGFVRYFWPGNGKGRGLRSASSTPGGGLSPPPDAEPVLKGFTEIRIMKQKSEVIEGTAVAHD